MPRKKRRTQRLFVGREDVFDTFWAALDGLEPYTHSVLSVYGVGGIGKTRLLDELRQRLTAERPDVAHALHSFRETQARTPERALLTLRSTLHDKHGIAFPTFDVAFSVYWKLRNPHLPLAKSELAFLEEGELVGDLFGALEDVPIVGAIAKIPRVLHKLGKATQRWWTTVGEAQLKKIIALDDAEKVAEWLPMFWAADVEQWLKDHHGQQIVLFFDTLEALADGTVRVGEAGAAPDGWLREWAAELPGVLWVLAGRDGLRWTDADPSWDEAIAEMLLGGLSDEDIERFLTDSGVAEPKVRAMITAKSEGLPLYLDLAVDTYEQIHAVEKRPPLPEEFDANLSALLERFLHYHKAERPALFVLSVPESFDLARYRDLMATFATGYPATKAGLDALAVFSFLEQPEPGRYALHALVREALSATHDPEERVQVHQHLFGRANEMLVEIDIKAITEEQRQALRDGFAHGIEVLESETFIRWYNTLVVDFKKGAEWSLLVPLTEIAVGYGEQVLGPDHRDTLLSVNNLAGLLRAQGKFEKAEPLYRRALNGAERTLGFDHSDTLAVVNNLAGLLQVRGLFEEAELLHRRALDGAERIHGRDHPNTLVGVGSLAGLLRLRGLLNEAEPLFRRALDGTERTLGPDHPDTLRSASNLAHLLKDRGLLNEAEPLFRRALDGTERTLGPDHPDTLRSANNIAGILQSQGQLDEAEQIYRRALDGRNRVLGPNHPDTLETVNNLAYLLFRRDLPDEAELLYRRALDGYERVLDLNHPDTLGVVNNLAGLLWARGLPDEAESLLRRAIDGFAKKLGRDHPKTKGSCDNLEALLQARNQQPP